MARHMVEGKKSRPSRARGLKLGQPINLGARIVVAPFTGAWIETANRLAVSRYCSSRPSRARGLKLRRHASPPPLLLVAPFTGAWIETFAARPDFFGLPVAPFTGAWIETSKP